MSKQYFIQGANPGEKLKVSDIETLLLKEDRVVLYIAYHVNELFLRVVKPNQSIKFEKVSREVMDAVPQRLKAENIDHMFESLANIMQHMHSTNLDEVVPMKTDRFLSLRRAKSVLNHNHGKILHALSRWKKRMMMMMMMMRLDSSSKRALRLRYDNIIGPFDNLLEGSKIIVFPEGELHRVPFQAMMDENGNYLSERSVCNQAGSILDYPQVNPRQPNGLSLWEGCSDCGRYRCWSSFVERKKKYINRKIYI